MLASCLDQIEDDRDLVASAKCLVQARHKANLSTCRHDFEQGRAADKSTDIPAFITISGSEEEDSLKNHDYEGKSVKKHHQMGTKGKTSHPSRLGFENKFLKRSPSETSVQFSQFSNILNLNHMKNLISHNFDPFKYLTGFISNSLNQQKFHTSKSMHLNRLLPIDKKSGQVNLMPTKHLMGENESSETLYLIENEIKGTKNLVGQSSNSLYYEKFGRTTSEREHSEKSEMVENTDLPPESRSSRKSNWYFFVPRSSSEQEEELYSNSNLSKFREKKLWQRWRRSYRLITNHVMKSDHLIVDVGDYISLAIFHTIYIFHIILLYQ